jgi:hypothetical protein
VVHLKVHVEADAAGPRYRGAVVYLTSREPFEGVLRLELREGVAVTGCWPRWPDKAGERSAAWRVEPYVRRFGGSALFSFGVRLDLEGRAELSASVGRWSAEGGVVELEAGRSGGLRAVVGPLAPGCKVLGFRGSLRVIEGALTYVVVEGEHAALRVSASGLVTGYLEYEPIPCEMPFEVELKGLRVTSVERTLIVRLEDLLA